MNVLVTKFGGTCVESRANQEMVAERLMEFGDEGCCIIAVISAMGREGQPYSTAELVKLVKEVDEKIEPRELDLLMSCGEIISTVAMAHLLKSKGYDTVALSGGQAGLITDYYYGHAQVIDIKPAAILRALDDGRIVFVAGFQGVTDRHAITTLGEGGSDYTAVAIAVTLLQTPKLPLGEELNVMPLHIYKDVDGVMTANPKHFLDEQKQPLAKLPRPLRTLSYDELCVMSGFGAEVMQHKASLMARKHALPLVIKNYLTNAPGTEVGPGTLSDAGGPVAGLADLPQLFVFTVRSDKARLPGQLAAEMRKDRLTHYQVAAEPGLVRFAVKREKYRDVGAMIRRVTFMRELDAELSAGEWGLVSMVGEGMRGKAERVAGDARQVLEGVGIGIHGGILGEISASFLVEEAQRTRAVRELHSAFCL